MRKLLIPIVSVGLIFAFLVSAAIFNASLDKGLRHSEVEELQKFLKEPPVGGPDIYPEGLVTGYFGPLTEAAVKRFQSRYGIVSSGSPETTGYGRVGPLTRAKLNELLAAVAPAPAVPPAEITELPTEPTEAELPACRERKVPGEYTSIGSAVVAACAGDTILISAGEYSESLVISKENLTIKSESGAEKTIIRHPNTSGVTVSASKIVIDGITVLGDFSQNGIEINVSGPANITIQNSIIKNNFNGLIIKANSGEIKIKRNVFADSKFFAISDGMKNGSLAVENNAMVDNDIGYYLDSTDGSHKLTNNIIARNRTYGIAVSSAGPEREHEILSVAYTNVWDNDGGDYFSNKRNVAFNPVGAGNFSTDPLFVPGTYRLRPQSLMIDAGDPASPVDPDGSRADIGAYPFDQSQPQTSVKNSGFLANLWRAFIGLFK